MNKGRAIKVKNPQKRITKEEMFNLKEAFNRIQDGQVITLNPHNLDD